MICETNVAIDTIHEVLSQRRMSLNTQCVLFYSVCFDNAKQFEAGRRHRGDNQKPLELFSFLYLGENVELQSVLDRQRVNILLFLHRMPRGCCSLGRRRQ